MFNKYGFIIFLILGIILNIIIALCPLNWFSICNFIAVIGCLILIKEELNRNKKYAKKNIQLV